MAIRDKIISGGNGINFTKETDSSADWPSIANSTYFRDVADGLIHYKDSTGAVLELYGAGGVSGSGTTNYVSKFTGTGTIGNSQTQDNGANIAVNGAIVSAYKFAVYSTTPGENYNIYGNTTVNGAVGIAGVNQGVGASTNYGASASAQNSTTKNIGIYSAADGPSAGINIGGQFIAVSATNNYSVQLQDGTEGIGKVLTSMTADGKARWATPTSASISGYTLTLGHATNTMSRNTTWNIGGLIYATPSATNVGSRRIAVPKSGVVKKVSIMTTVNGVSSSASPAPTIQFFNNTTSTATTITGTNLYSGTVPFTRHDIYTISAAVTEGDEINVQAIIANLVTEPTQVTMLIQLWIEEI